MTTRFNILIKRSVQLNVSKLDELVSFIQLGWKIVFECMNFCFKYLLC